MAAAALTNQLNALVNNMEKPNVDFDRVDSYVHQLKGSSASVGAQKVKNTCIQFREFCQQRSRDGCLKTLDLVRTEFYDLRSKFQAMLQIMNRKAESTEKKKNCDAEAEGAS
uniref:Histidine-containing phosphotransfer protein n=1 Tax=Leersia perrieri TaxID=77586 RepID=A0A0D9XAU0_9ORYZ